MPKDIAHRQRRNLVGNNSRPRMQIVPSEFTIPSARGGWLKSTKDAWDRYGRSQLAVLVREETLDALDRLFCLKDRWERAYRQTRSKQLVKGSQNQMVLNPLLRQMSAWEAEIRQLEDRFGLTPGGRLRLGQAFGDASRSLEEANRQLEQDEDEGDEDPRAALQQPAPDTRRRAAAKSR